MSTAPRKPLWLIPNLLSLDAPLVAVAWLYVFAKTWRVSYLPWEAYTALGLVVWMIYALDRLLDSSLTGEMASHLQSRHEFHRQHRRTFIIGIGIAAAVATALVVTRLPRSVYGFATTGALLVGGFFMLSIFVKRESGAIPYAKNAIAGLAFAYGTAMLAFVYSGFHLSDMTGSGELVCFSVLCILNISAIDLWEHASRSPDPETKAADELALTLPLTLLAAGSLFYALKDHEMTTRPFFYAILTGAALLHILNRMRAQLSTDALRALADAALLAPVLIFLAFPSQ